MIPSSVFFIPVYRPWETAVMTPSPGVPVNYVGDPEFFLAPGFGLV